jgi:hypothetical protein
MMCPEGLELKKAADAEPGSQATKDKLTSHTHLCEICGRETSKEPEVD